MSSSPAPEFDQFIHDFITSYAGHIFVDHEEQEPVIFTVYCIPRNLVEEGPLPASKSAIQLMPTVTVTDVEDCAICLTEYGVAGEAKELPCKHRYHSGCIIKWLGIHGSCPVCRYEMPVDEEDKQRRDGGLGWQLMITVTRRTPVTEPGGIASDSVVDIDSDVGSNSERNQHSMEDLD